jgi:hypothetical protein
VYFYAAPLNAFTGVGSLISLVLSQHRHNDLMIGFATKNCLVLKRLVA